MSANDDKLLKNEFKKIVDTINSLQSNSDIKDYFKNIISSINIYFEELLKLIKTKQLQIVYKNNKIGIDNPNNYCYRNSIMQILLHTCVFREYIFNLDEIELDKNLQNDSDCNKYIESLKDFFKEYYSSIDESEDEPKVINNLNEKYLSLLELCPMIDKSYAEYRITNSSCNTKKKYLRRNIKQEDSSEYLTKTINSKIESCIPVIQTELIKKKIISTNTSNNSNNEFKIVKNYLETNKETLNTNKTDEKDVIINRYLNKIDITQPNIYNLLFDYCGNSIDLIVLKSNTQESRQVIINKYEIQTELKISINQTITTKINWTTQELYNKIYCKVENLEKEDFDIYDNFRQQIENDSEIEESKYIFKFVCPNRDCKRKYNCSELQGIYTNLELEYRYDEINNLGAIKPLCQNSICKRQLEKKCIQCKLKIEETENTYDIERQSKSDAFQTYPNILRIQINRYDPELQFYHKVDQEIQINDNIYYLYAVNYKSGPVGDMGFGHYISCIRDWDIDNSEFGEWYKYDDTIVRKLKSHETLDSHNVYQLFYYSKDFLQKITNKNEEIHIPENKPSEPHLPESLNEEPFAYLYNLFKRDNFITTTKFNNSILNNISSQLNKNKPYVINLYLKESVYAIQYSNSNIEAQLEILKSKGIILKKRASQIKNAAIASENSAKLAAQAVEPALPEAVEPALPEPAESEESAQKQAHSAQEQAESASAQEQESKKLSSIPPPAAHLLPPTPAVRQKPPAVRQEPPPEKSITVQIRIKKKMPTNDEGIETLKTTIKTELANLLKINAKRIIITNLGDDSVVVDFYIKPPQGSDVSSSNKLLKPNEVKQLLESSASISDSSFTITETPTLILPKERFLDDLIEIINTNKKDEIDEIKERILSKIEEIKKDDFITSNIFSQDNSGKQLTPIQIIIKQRTLVNKLIRNSLPNLKKYDNLISIKYCNYNLNCYIDDSNDLIIKKKDIQKIKDDYREGSFSEITIQNNLSIETSKKIKVINSESGFDEDIDETFIFSKNPGSEILMFYNIIYRHNRKNYILKNKNKNEKINIRENKEFYFCIDDGGLPGGTLSSNPIQIKDEDSKGSPINIFSTKLERVNYTIEKLENFRKTVIYIQLHLDDSKFNIEELTLSNNFKIIIYNTQNSPTEKDITILKKASLSDIYEMKVLNEKGSHAALSNFLEFKNYKYQNFKLNQNLIECSEESSGNSSNNFSIKFI